MIPLDKLIRFHRRQAGLSQIELAEIAEVSRIVVQSVEAGEEGIQWRNLCAILKVLNIKLEPSGPLISAWKSSLTEEEDSDEI
ncbi:MAG: helix-turn-helix transcriptional regulator [Verrucomicrobiales bacterium]|nr:helix-turn-helix transcriptional regulator [Verrucomicrobiales bacterium]